MAGLTIVPNVPWHRALRREGALLRHQELEKITVGIGIYDLGLCTVRNTVRYQVAYISTFSVPYVLVSVILNV